MLRLFGEQSEKISAIHVSDWSHELFTATREDLFGRPTHPSYESRQPRTLFENQLIIAGTEAAIEHGGYLEGALESVDAVMPFVI